MAINILDTAGTGNRAWILPAAAATAYPLFLRSAYGSFRLLADGGGMADRMGYGVAYVAALAGAYAVPVVAAFMACTLAGKSLPESEARRTLRILHVVFAVPPLFTALGVYASVLGLANIDIPVWIAAWGGFIVLSSRGHPAPHAVVPSSSKSKLRVFHGAVAVLVLLTFLAGHLLNHVAALWSPELHGKVMRALETVYRARVIEPALVLSIGFLIVSGLAMAWRYTAAPQGAFRTLQTLTGFYVAVFIASHLSAVFIMARWVEHIPTNWAFASGAPAGLIRDPWNIRLIPHYSIAVWAIITHVGLGIRGVMRAHGIERAADTLARFVTGLGAAVSGLITLALLGVHLGTA